MTMRGPHNARRVLAGMLMYGLLCIGTAELAKFGCLETFTQANRSREFDKCRQTPCFIFLSEPPYIRLDRDMKSDMESKVFPCGNPRGTFKRLRGSAFEVMKKTSAANALCVWGGPKCRFNAMVDFIDKAADEEPDYMFGATGLLQENTARLRKNIVQSISLVQEVLAIFGPQISEREVFPFERLKKPFRPMAWVTFALFFLAILMGAWLTACAFDGNAWSPRRMFHFFMDPRDTVQGSVPMLTLQESHDKTQAQCARIYATRVTDRLSLYKVARLMLRMSITAMIVIFLLFYELSVVNVLFREQSKPKVRDVSALSKEQLKEYAVEENAGTEHVWNTTVYTKGKYNTSSQLPWKRCSNLAQCFDWALDKSNDVKYVVGFQSAGVFQRRIRNVCNMTNYETSPKLYSFGAGWLYGKRINESFRRTMDKELLNLHETEQLPGIIVDNAGVSEDSSCSWTIIDIDVGIIGASVFVLVMPSLLLVVCMIIYHKLCQDLFRNRQNQQRPPLSHRPVSITTPEKTASTTLNSGKSTCHTFSDAARREYTDPSSHV